MNFANSKLLSHFLYSLAQDISFSSLKTIPFFPDNFFILRDYKL